MSAADFAVQVQGRGIMEQGGIEMWGFPPHLPAHSTKRPQTGPSLSPFNTWGEKAQISGLCVFLNGGINSIRLFYLYVCVVCVCTRTTTLKETVHWH